MNTLIDWLRVEHQLLLRPRLIISFPKSGRTWLRVMLDQLGIMARYYHANYKQPLVITDRERREPRRYRRSLILLRDPRDVIVSAFHSHTKRESMALDGLGNLIRDPDIGIERILHYNLNWAERAKWEPNFALITYEGLLEDTTDTLAGIVRFFGLRRSEAEIDRVVEDNRFTKMREREAKGEYESRYGDILTPGDREDPDSFKVRRGQAGGFREEMSTLDIDFCDRVLRKTNYFSRINACLEVSFIGTGAGPWHSQVGDGLLNAELDHAAPVTRTPEVEL